MGNPDAATVVGLLAEGDRLRAFAAVALGASRMEDVARTAGLGSRAAVRALERLAGAGLIVEEPGTGLRVVHEVLQEAARQAAALRPVVDPEALGATAEQAGVLRNFLTPEGKLTHIPSARSKRLVVLDYLAGRFEPGRSYPEGDVNFILGSVHQDYAALRRYMVDEGLLERRQGFYWRAGGTFEVE